MDFISTQFGAIVGICVEIGQDFTGDMSLSLLSCQCKAIAAIAHFDTQSFLDLAQVRVKLPTQHGQAAAIVRLESDFMGDYPVCGGCSPGAAVLSDTVQVFFKPSCSANLGLAYPNHWGG